MNNELMHYGVKGMKWGVRRFQPYSKDYKGTGKEVGAAKKSSDVRIRYDDDVIVKKGTKAYRISGNKSDTGNLRYVTVDQNDRNFYKGIWPSTLKGNAGVYKNNEKVYEQTYRLKEDLISPSAAKRQKIAADLASSPQGVFEIAYGRMTNRLQNANKWTTKETIDQINGFMKSKDPDFYKAFGDLMSSTIGDLKSKDEIGKATLLLSHMGHNDRIKTMYGKAVVDAGYNAVIDDHGADFAGNKMRVNAPLIVLKADKALKQVGSKKVSDIDSSIAFAQYSRDISTIPGAASEKNYVPNVVKEYYNTKNYYDNDTYDYIYDREGKRVK